MPEHKYHIALSFAGEDRAYVEQVAKRLDAAGVLVFYDKFEEATLWGKNLFTHLSDVYENKALFTVMFISEHYKNKLWTNHERESAQARAFENNKEYILPAFFDESVKIPGVLKTTGRIALAKKTPDELAALIIEKLVEHGVELSPALSYSDEAKADVDFPLPKNNKIATLITAMKSCTWPTQAPAVATFLDLDWAKLKKNELFVLGRNVYQCACGSERTAESALKNLRAKLGQQPTESAIHFLNGMFFEVYFDKEGEFRGHELKGRYHDQLLELQTVKKFEPSITFVREALLPYRAHLPFLPNTTLEIVKIHMFIKRSDPPLVKSLKLRGHELIKIAKDDDEFLDGVWKLSFVKFTKDRLKSKLASAWSIPVTQLEIVADRKMPSNTEYRLSKDAIIAWPEEGIPDPE